MKKLAFWIPACLLALALLLTACTQPAVQETTAPRNGPNSDETPVIFDTSEDPSSSVIRLMALQGPTGMGLAPLLHRVQTGEETSVSLNATIVTSTEISNIAAAIANGTCDIAAVPINLASQLYKKTDGGIRILCANTLGVLSILENGDTVHSLEDLKGKTLYATGQGSTPEYILTGLLKKAGLENDVTVEYVADHTELAARMSKGQATLGMLPEPNVTVVLSSNESFRKALDVTELWNEAFGTDLVQGVYIVRADFLEDHPQAVEAFLKAYDESQKEVNADPAAAAELIIEAGVLPIPKAAVIAKAIPGAHITYLDGAEMKKSVSACLATLFEIAPASVGGTLPDDAAYYVK